MTAVVLDLSTKVRKTFWNLWKGRQQDLELPANVSELTPEKAFRMGHRKGFWEGALDATQVVASQSLEDTIRSQ